MSIKVRRIYDNAAKGDGLRVLVDRMWPRGVKKEEAKVDVWAKELAPSRELVAWFHADKEKRFKEFEKRYKKELTDKKNEACKVLGERKRITLVTAVKDVDHSHIPTLSAFFEKLRA